MPFPPLSNGMLYVFNGFENNFSPLEVEVRWKLGGAELWRRLRAKKAPCGRKQLLELQLELIVRLFDQIRIQAEFIFRSNSTGS